MKNKITDKEFIDIVPMRFKPIKCYHEKYDKKTGDKSEISEVTRQGAEWGNYWPADINELTILETLVDGHFGRYNLHEGFKVDFYPYDMTRAAFIKYIEDFFIASKMNYIDYGKTKAVIINYSIVWPGNEY